MVAHPGFIDPVFLAPQEYAGVGTAGDGPAEAIWRFKQLLVSSGRWAVAASGGGTASGLFSAVGDVLTTSALFKHTGAWFRLRAAVNDGSIAGAGRQEWLVQLDDAANGTFLVRHSRAAGFTGGAPDEDSLPTATDSFELLSAGSGWFSSWTAGTTRVIWGVADQDANAFYFFAADTGNQSSGIHCWFVDPMTRPYGQDLNGTILDPFPYVFSAAGDSDSYRMARLANATEGSQRAFAYMFQTAAGNYVANKIAPLVHSLASNTTNQIPGNVALGNYPGNTAAQEFAAILWTRPNTFATLPRGVKGWSSLFLYQVVAPPANTKILNSYRGTARALINLGTDMAAAHSGAAVTLGAAGTWTVQLAQAWDVRDVEIATTAFTGVSPPAGADLAADYETARWTPIEFTLAASHGGPLVMAKIGTDAFWTHVVYDPTDGFHPLYAEHSTVVDNGDETWTFRVLPLGGWWRGDVTLRGGLFVEVP